MKIEIENSILILIIIIIVLIICIGASYIMLHTNNSQDNNVVVNNTQNKTNNTVNATVNSTNQAGCSNCANGNQAGSYYWVGNKEYCSVCHRLVADMDNKAQQEQAARDMDSSYHYGRQTL